MLKFNALLLYITLGRMLYTEYGSKAGQKKMFISGIPNCLTKVGLSSFHFDLPIYNLPGSCMM